MASSTEVTVAGYLASLTPERREVISTVRATILSSLPHGYEEVMQYGMISYVVPFIIFPSTYNNQPLAYCALASQKNYCSLYLSSVYSDPVILNWFTKEFEKAGKKLQMGKSCVRFKKVEDLPLSVISQTIAKTSVEEFIKIYKHSRKE